MRRVDNAETARACIELMAKDADYDIWSSMLTHDAEFLKPFHPPGFPKRIVGRIDWVNSQREGFKVIRDFRWIDLELHNTDQQDVVYGTARSRAELVDGRIYENEYVLIVTFRDGLVKELREYLDPLSVLRFFGTEIDGGRGIRSPS